MTCKEQYQANFFLSIPPNSGHIAICVAEQTLTIAAASSSGVLAYLKTFSKDENESADEMYKTVFAEHQDVFAKRYNKVSVQLTNADYSIIPAALFKEGNEGAYLSPIIEESEQKSYAAQQLPFPASVVVYAYPKSLETLCNQSFADITFHSFIAQKLPWALSKEGLVIDVDVSYFNFFNIRNGELLGCNRLKYSNMDDIAYYALLLLKEVGVDPDKGIVHLNGATVLTQAVKETLTSFIGEVIIERTSSPLEIKSDFKGDIGTYHSLFNLLNENS